MKLSKLILFILCITFIFSIKGISQVKVGADGAIHPTGVYPSAISKEVLSNVYRVNTIADRNNIPMIFRDTGMIAHVTEDSVNYQLQGGISNSNWTILSSGVTIDTSNFIFNINFRPGSVIDTLYYTKATGETDFYYVVVRDGLISGGIVTYSGFDLTYYVSAAVYRKNGIFYQTNDTTIVLAPLGHPDSSRTDVFIVNTSGQSTTITGEEAANPLVPQINPDTDVFLTTITLTPTNANAGIDTVIIYDQNQEWIGSVSGTTANFAYPINVYRGDSTTSVGAISNNQYVAYTNGTSLNRLDYAGVSFFTRLKAVMNNSNNLNVSFWNSGIQVSNERVVPLNKSNITTYQGISLDFGSFTWTNSLFNQIRFRYSGGGGSYTGMYLDFIYLQNGISIPPTVATSIVLIGEVTGTGNTGTPINTTLSNTGVVSGTYGTADSVGRFIVDSKGRLAFAQNIDINKMDSAYLDGDSLRFVKNDLNWAVLAGTITDTSNLSYRIDTLSDFVNNIPQIDTSNLDYRIDTLSNHLDTAKANIRSEIPAQFNPIAGTNMSLSGSYPNITFNATGGGGSSQWRDTTNGIYYNSGNVGINTVNPEESLHVAARDTIATYLYAFGTVKKYQNYSGPSMRVRRSSDNAESDIGFDDTGILDTVTLKSFIGANSGFVTTLYNQGTRIGNFVQATASQQPAIVLSGVVQYSVDTPSIRIYNTNVHMANSAIVF